MARLRRKMAEVAHLPMAARVAALKAADGELARTPVTMADLRDAIHTNKPASGADKLSSYAKFQAEHGSGGS